MRQFGRVLLAPVLTLVSCFGGMTIDYVDFIQHAGIQYVAPFGSGLGREDVCK